MEVVIPENFYEDNVPSRLTGFETELDVRHPLTGENHNQVLNSFKGVLNKTPYDGYQDGRGILWLSNGVKMLIDVGHLEVCTPESLGPLDATTSLHSLPLTLKTMMEAIGSKCRVYNRSATLCSKTGAITTKGFHVNFITPTDSIGHDDIGILETHLVTQLFANGGIITKDGYNIAPKSAEIGNGISIGKLVDRTGAAKTLGILYDSDGTVDDAGGTSFGFSRFEDRTKTPGLPWSDFMGMATTSLLMRVLERPDMQRERRRLARLVLSNPAGDYKAIGADILLRNTYPTREGEQMTALEIASRIADIVCEACSRIELPADEVLAMDEWRSVLSDMRNIAHGKEELDVLRGRVGWAAKYIDMRKRYGLGMLREPTIQMAGRCLAWDRIVPSGIISEIAQRQQGLGIRAEALVDRSLNPPETRAKARVTHIQKTPNIEMLTWSRYKTMQKDAQDMHPYVTEALAA